MEPASQAIYKLGQRIRGYFMREYKDGTQEGQSHEEDKRTVAAMAEAHELLHAGDYEGYIARLNELRPAEGDMPGLGDEVRERHARMDYRAKEMKKRGRKGFTELGE